MNQIVPLNVILKVSRNIKVYSGLKFIIYFFLTISAIYLSVSCNKESKSASPVAIYQKNTYYFQDTKGKPIMFTGDYTWEMFSAVDFDYIKMFESLKSRGLNLARIWLWWGCEQFSPLGNKIHIEPYLREGPGVANDGRPKYNLDKFNPAFFQKLTDFCKAAEKNGIYLQLMMMDAWMIKHDYLWKLNAFNRDNNLNNVDGDPNDTRRGTDKKQGFCSMGNQKVADYQKAYIKKVVETVNGFNKIFFEIANENYYSEEWELMLCDYIKEIEKSMPNQHMTIRRDFPSHSYVVQKWDPVIVHKGIMEKRNLKVPLLFDTDWIINENDDEVRKAAWSSVASGAHFSYMDNSMDFYRDTIIADKRATLHKQIDHLARFMKEIKPWEMIPDDSLVVSGLAFAMANNKVLFAYLPEGDEIRLDLSKMKGRRVYRWYNPLTGEFSEKQKVSGSSETSFRSPDDNDWVLLVGSH